MSKILKATHDGNLNIAGFVISCSVLDDEKRTRVLSQSELVRNALGRAQGGSRRGKARLPRFIGAKNISPYLSDSLLKAIEEPILYQPKKGFKAHGFPANLLPELCEVWIKAKEAGVLKPHQLETAKRAEILYKGIALVGAVALVDEATGYQYERDRKALEQILTLYVREEFLAWVKRFPDEFYKQLFRLKGWIYNPATVKRPKMVASLTGDIVYKRLPPGIYDKLKQLNPANEKGNRAKRHHQYLTEDVGNPHLERHLASVITLMRIAPSWMHFKRNLERAFPVTNGQLKFAFNDYEEDEDES